MILPELENRCLQRNWKPIRIFVWDGANDNRSRRPGRNRVISDLNLVAVSRKKDAYFGIMS